MYLKHLGLRSWTAAIIPLLSIAEASAQVLSREEAIRIATERNPAVIAARGQWNAARARVSQARALPDPELELEYEELPGGFSLREFGERNIGFSQTIEFPVRWWLRNRAARQSASATKMSAFEMTKLEVATRVKVAYDRVLLNQRLLDYAEQNLTLAQDLLDKARVRFEAGDVPQLEILRAEVEAGRATNRVTVARNDLSKSKAALNALLARDIRASLTVVGDLSTRPVEVNVERLKALAVERRPDLLGARSALAGAQSLRSSAISSFLPDLNLSVFRQTFQEASGREGFWHVSFGLEVPLWGLFRQRGEIAEAGAEVSRATALEDATRYGVLLDVEGAFLDMTAAEERVRLFEARIVNEAELAYDAARRGYEEGKVSYLELLEAQRALTETRMEYAQTLFNYRSALATLERAVGGDLPE